MDFDANDKEKDLNDTASGINSDLIRGHINTIILRTLYDGDKYGYEIINEIEEKSKGQYSLKQPTLYSALKRLETQDFVTSYWGGVSNGGRRKYFQLTEKGKTIAEQNLAEWEYSRTVIDRLISEREFDFNKPAPTAVDFNLLKKSTTRAHGVSGGDEYDEIDLNFDFGAPVSESVFEQDPETKTVQETFQSEIADPIEQSEPEIQTQSPTLSVEEQQRIHENYKALVGEQEEAAVHYYEQVNQQNRFQEQRNNGNPEPLHNEFESRQNLEQDATYLENNAIASELLYSNKSPAERNYKQLLAKLYNNTQHYPADTPQEESDFAEQSNQPVESQSNAPMQSQQPARSFEQSERISYENSGANTASNIEFYDIREKAEYDGLRVNTANKTRTKSQKINTFGNTYDKGKALFNTAIYVFIVALIESIIITCLKGTLSLNVAYIITPFILTFTMLGVFMFLFMRGYGKNSRKSQAKSFISSSLIIFTTIVLVICLIAYLIIIAKEITPSFVEIAKFALLPCLLAFNIPLFSIFYNYNRNKQ